MIANTLGNNPIGSRRCHQMFKAFLSLQNPLIDLPPREKYLNLKIWPLLAWMNFIFPTAWLLGIKVDIAEMTMGF